MTDGYFGEVDKNKSFQHANVLLGFSITNTSVRVIQERGITISTETYDKMLSFISNQSCTNRNIRKASLNVALALPTTYQSKGLTRWDGGNY